MPTHKLFVSILIACAASSCSRERGSQSPSNQKHDTFGNSPTAKTNNAPLPKWGSLEYSQSLVEIQKSADLVLETDDLVHVKVLRCSLGRQPSNTVSQGELRQFYTRSTMSKMDVVVVIIPGYSTLQPGKPDPRYALGAVLKKSGVKTVVFHQKTHGRYVEFFPQRVVADGFYIPPGHPQLE